MAASLVREAGADRGRQVEAAYRRALELNPSYATAHHWYAWYLGSLGRHDESLGAIARAQELDPLSLIIATDVSRMYYFARRYDQAERAIRVVLDMDASFARARSSLGLVLLATGRYAEAARAFDGNSEDRDLLAQAYILTGRREEGARIAAELEKESDQQFIPATKIALLHLQLGNTDRALDWLGRALEERTWLVAQMKVEPRFDALRGHPRFEEYLRQLRLPD